MQQRIRFICLAVLLGLFASCSSDGTSANNEVPSVVVTYSAIGDVVSRLVGDAATVTVLIPNGQDQHDFMPSAQDVETINKADGMIFQTEKQLKEFGEKIPADKKAPIETALANLKEAHASQDTAKVDSALEAMNTAWTAASEEIYKAQAAGAGGPEAGAPGADGGQANGGASNDTVEDAQFEEVK